MESAELENRFTYHPPRPDQVQTYERIRAAGLNFAALIADLTPASREQSLSITHIEDAVMWANAAEARHG